MTLFTRRFQAAILGIAAILLTYSVPAVADTYQFYNLGNSNSENPWGIDDQGTVVLQASGVCASLSSQFCYLTVPVGQPGTVSSLLRHLHYDNGSPCALSLSSNFQVTGSPICNGGRELFGAFYTDSSNHMSAGAFTGADPLLDLLISGNGVIPYLVNSLGDMVWINGLQENVFEAYDVTTHEAAVLTPEPTSFALLATGALALVIAMRRRAHPFLG